MFRTFLRSQAKRLTGLAILGLAAAPLLAPVPALAWWRGWGWHGGVAVRVFVPPIVVGPPVYYAPPPAYYVPPPPVAYAPLPPYPAARWVPGYYTPRGYYVPGHWG